MLVFGPVPSRRLGSSLGINHVPPKYCPFSCVYCQVGRTSHLEIERRVFFPLDQILADVEKRIGETRQAGYSIDYLTLVPDGEPTLDIQLANLIEALRAFSLPVAVITNASLIAREDVQEALCLADWVSVKVDAVNEDVWRRINRPQRTLSLSAILSGVVQFRKRFRGEFVTETMLVDGVNDSGAPLAENMAFLRLLQPYRSWLSIPTRPPAESWVRPPQSDVLRGLYRTAVQELPCVGFLFEPEPSAFLSSGNLAEEILAITAVHPMREESLRKMIAIAGADWEVVERLLAEERLARVAYLGSTFYTRRRAT